MDLKKSFLVLSLSKNESEIGSGFGEPGGKAPPIIPRSSSLSREEKVPFFLLPVALLGKETTLIAGYYFNM